MNCHTKISAAPNIEIRRATINERPFLEDLKELSIRHLLDPMLTPGQRDTMRQITPFDPILIEDGTYYVVTVNGWIAASGGWTRRAALYRAPGCTLDADSVMDPTRDAAGIRAMYTHPDFARQGLGRLVLSTALAAARIAGFRRAKLLATSAGERLYRASGWTTDKEQLIGPDGHASVPGYWMSRAI